MDEREETLAAVQISVYQKAISDMLKTEFGIDMAPIACGNLTHVAEAIRASLPVAPADGETLAERMHREGWRTGRSQGRLSDYVERLISTKGESQYVFVGQKLAVEMRDLETPPAVKIARQLHSDGWRPTTDACVLRYDLPGGGPYTTFRVEPAVYEAMCEIEKPPAPTAEQTLSELTRIQMLEELLENSDAAFAWQRDRAEDADSLVERLQERIRELESDSERSENEIASREDVQRRLIEERDSAEARVAELEQQRGEPVGWVVDRFAHGVWKDCRAERFSRELVERIVRATVKQFAGPPEPAEHPQGVPAFFGKLPDDGTDDGVAERDTDPEMPSLPDARAGYDAGDEDDYDGKVL